MSEKDLETTDTEDQVDEAIHFHRHETIKDRLRGTKAYPTMAIGQKRNAMTGKPVPMDKDDTKDKTASKPKNEEVEDTDKDLVDESVALDTLKAGSRPAGTDPKSKIEAITSVLGAMHSMRKDDLTKWYHQAMDLIGKEASSLPGGASADSNASTIDMKGGAGPKTRDPMPKIDHKNNPLAAISVREDVEEMFEGQDLSEEFKEKASTLFEAAVQAKIITEMARIEEEYENALEEEVAAIAESMQENIDKYLDYVVERWMEENEVAIESSLRNEVMEEFVDGLKNLFTEHYMEMPEEKVDVVEALAAKVEELETRLDEAINENSEMKEIMLEVERVSAIEEMAEDLTMTESDKFAALSEGIEFNGDIDSYKRKLSIVKENYFKKNSSRVVDLEEETFEGDQTGERTVSFDPNVNRYASAISRTLKK